MTEEKGVKIALLVMAVIAGLLAITDGLLMTGQIHF